MVVVADAHLGQVPPATRDAFHAFLEAVPSLGDALLVNGDLFDFWCEYGAVIPRKHFSTIARLEALRARGVPITFIGGNHDRWGGDFFTHDLGIAYHPTEVELVLAGRRTWVAHGDGLTEQHWSASLLHHVLKHRWTVSAFRALHPALGFWLADRLSGVLADSTKDQAVLDRAERAQATYAREMLKRRPELDLVLLAHTHRPALETVAPGRAYCNPGAWLDGFRYAIVTESVVELRQFPGA
ncbi:MAG TPA: UDP-2,3-diacylglucosamine diphosphatase [Gemmatimonadales bacterium]|nr:UDP-2,3-diacylglucosamine diphosphatase [Gemmatimonadales bacterium]